MAAKHDIRGSGSDLRHVVSFTEDQVDLIAALYSLHLPKPQDPEARKSNVTIEQKLREEGYYEFTHICSDEPIDLLNKPKGWTIKPQKKSRNYRNPAFEKVRHYITLEKYEKAVYAYYEMLGDRLYFNGQLHHELVYLKRLAHIPLTGRDLLYFRNESSRNELINSNLSEYCSCIDLVLDQYQKTGVKSPLGIIIENAPNMEELIEQRKKDWHLGVYLWDGKFKRDNTPVTIDSFSVQYDKCLKGTLFDAYPDQIQHCRIIETPEDRRYAGLWTNYSPSYYQRKILDKGLHLNGIEAYGHKLWKRRMKIRMREPDFTTATSLNEIEKFYYGTNGIRYTGCSHKIDGKEFYEIDLLRENLDLTEDFGNPFIELVEEILREAENLLRENHDLPRISEGWISEMQLYNLIKTILPEAQHHATPEWLKPQHIDIFVPSEKLAFEYQGRQHFEPVDFFGGEESFERTKKLDARKMRKCKSNGVLLIYWRYDEPINQKVLVEKLKQDKINV